MKLELKKHIIVSLLLFFTAAHISAKGKVFYNSKSNIVGITGNYELISFADKFYNTYIELPPINRRKDPKEICAEWNEENVGKSILDALFCYDGTSLSEEELENLAMRNVLLADDERAAYGVIEKENILKEDYLPILENNYIFFNYTKTSSGKKKDKEFWVVYKVDINKDILDMVFNSWNDIEKYNQIKVTISYVASGKKRSNMTKMKREISHKVPAFAIRGQVISRSPFKMNIGKREGVKNRDKIVIYRSKEKKGKMVSSRVSTTRACNVADSTAYLYTFAGGQASYKKGDIAVLEPHKNSSVIFTGNYMDHSYNLNFTYDNRVKLSPLGFSQYFIAMLGVGTYDNFNKRLYMTENGDLVYSPIIMNFGLGYGIGYEFAHCVEIMPYFMAQWEGMLFSEAESSSSQAYRSSEGSEATSNSIRFPVGARLNLNIVYPVQLVVGAEYIFNIKIPVNDSSSTKVYSDPEKFFFKPTGYKRNGLNIYAGLRFNF